MTGLIAPQVWLILACLGVQGTTEPRPDILIADFEGTTYGEGWQATGPAFGAAPARGTLPGQMSVEGFEGQGLVNTFAGGDDSEGTLISPPFRVERRYLNFLIGGGKWPEQTCVDLVIAGRTVRTATGPNDSPGGSERLAWSTWDLGDLTGQTASLRVVDHRKGSWGHINLDQVAQSDARRQPEPATRRLAPANRDYVGITSVNFPVDPKAPLRRLRLLNQQDQVVREFDIRLGDGPGSFTTFLNLVPFLGQELRITADLPAGSTLLNGIKQRSQISDQAPIFAEVDRPRFHFTSRRGWLNDPNGLVWLNGKYHLFYQHNPYGWEWGNMHWGHATSPDLVHWTEQPIALYPQRYGDWAFSGSAVVDHLNTSGFGVGGKPPLVAAYTSTGRGECIVWSRDEGQSWTEFAGNPVVKHAGRDPRLFWHEPTKRWIMAVYDEANKKEAIVFHSSPDLKVWTEESRIDGFFECPDIFELPVQGAKPARSLWVLSAADGKYRLGQFDGHKFTPETDKLTLWHGDFYAAQTFSDTPDGRRIQIGWARGIDFPGMPFNQQMTIPCELTLRTTADGPRLFAAPVAEIAGLQAAPETWQGIRFDAKGFEDAKLPQIAAADGIDLTVDFGVNPGGLIVTWLGSEIRYDGEKQMLHVAGLEVPLKEGVAPTRFERSETGDSRGVRVNVNPEPLASYSGGGRLRILGDRRSLEVFGNDGQVAISRRITAQPGVPALQLATEKRSPLARSFQLLYAPLKSAWPAPK